MAVASPPSTCRTSSNRSSRPSRSAKARAWDFQSATALSATTAVRSTSKAFPARGAFFAYGSRCGHLAKSNTGTVTTSISRHKLWQLVDVEDPREQNSALDQWQDLPGTASHNTWSGRDHATVRLFSAPQLQDRHPSHTKSASQTLARRRTRESPCDR